MISITDNIDQIYNGYYLSQCENVKVVILYTDSEGRVYHIMANIADMILGNADEQGVLMVKVQYELDDKPKAIVQSFTLNDLRRVPVDVIAKQFMSYRK